MARAVSRVERPGAAHSFLARRERATAAIAVARTADEARFSEALTWRLEREVGANTHVASWSGACEVARAHCEVCPRAEVMSAPVAEEASSTTRRNQAEDQEQRHAK
jgi:hypothetical protein